MQIAIRRDGSMPTKVATMMLLRIVCAAPLGQSAGSAEIALIWDTNGILALGRLAIGMKAISVVVLAEELERILVVIE